MKVENSSFMVLPRYLPFAPAGSPSLRRSADHEELGMDILAADFVKLHKNCNSRYFRLANDNLRHRWSSGVSGKDAGFDYVIIGGGTAGLAMAARLAENQASTVAVIEVGGFYEDIPVSNLSIIPAQDIVYSGSSPSDTNPLVDWGFVTTLQAVSSI